MTSVLLLRKTLVDTSGQPYQLRKVVVFVVEFFIVVCFKINGRSSLLVQFPCQPQASLQAGLSAVLTPFVILGCHAL